ncbi:MAG: hypothetical protein IGS38_11885 [Synechococcales cyanobacterium M58_A2018_015]|nr:hypothetical protein [Synechococcales cyanobacterium M58_A2018_015]
MKKAFLYLTGMATLALSASPATATSYPVSSASSSALRPPPRLSRSVQPAPHSTPAASQPFLEFAPLPPAIPSSPPTIPTDGATDRATDRAAVPMMPAVPAAPAPTPTDQRLIIPWEAAEAPLGVDDDLQEVPPPPPPIEVPVSPNPAADGPSRFDSKFPAATPLPSKSSPSVELTFDLPSFKSAPASQPPPFQSASPDAPPPVSPPVPAQDYTLDQLFAGETGSLVAVAVGSAEGTRTPEGGRNRSYYGHTDPGNGVWNLGTFSYQHGAASPEEADAKQLNRLKKQAQTLQEKAAAKGLQLSLEEVLNGIDLANQAPKAALDTDGYIDWLAKARAQGMTGRDAILWARVRSFFDPATQRWNAPGLGNTEPRITHDQNRRMEAIASAIRSYDPQIAAAASRSQPIGWFTEELAVARLFAQKVVGLFASDAPVTPPASPDLPIVQQLLDLDR